MEKESYRGKVFEISTLDGLIVDLVRKCWSEIVCVCVGGNAHAYMCTYTHARVLVGVCLFPPTILQPKSWRGVADCGCESEFHSSLADN